MNSKEFSLTHRPDIVKEKRISHMESDPMRFNIVMKMI